MSRKMPPLIDDRERALLLSSSSSSSSHHHHSHCGQWTSDRMRLLRMFAMLLPWMMQNQRRMIQTTCNTHTHTHTFTYETNKSKWWIAKLLLLGRRKLLSAWCYCRRYYWLEQEFAKAFVLLVVLIVIVSVIVTIRRVTTVKMLLRLVIVSSMTMTCWKWW